MHTRHVVSSVARLYPCYAGAMDKHLEQYLEICKSIYERMERDGSWPWPDSRNSEDLVESEDNSNNV